MKKFTAQEFYDMAYARGLNLDFVVLYLDYLHLTFNEWCNEVIIQLSDIIKELTEEIPDLNNVRDEINRNINIIITITNWLNEQ